MCSPSLHPSLLELSVAVTGTDAQQLITSLTDYPSGNCSKEKARPRTSTGQSLREAPMIRRRRRRRQQKFPAPGRGRTRGSNQKPADARDHSVGEPLRRREPGPGPAPASSLPRDAELARL
jgi:hypothetical protein